ncbi:hypothetical protein E2C01_010441 [Portunus trituberculatus]|uniref:Uncharacterized protein n=1 Tax=Portunus trituberculatus TaxID=210409 RepID=A0A5B7D8M3_PORTR|nr:hypothetical protein [Portunus trituberculatus]
MTEFSFIVVLAIAPSTGRPDIKPVWLEVISSGVISVRSHRGDGGVMASEQPGAAFCELLIKMLKR